jgi:hypothetical protein
MRIRPSSSFFFFIALLFPPSSFAHAAWARGGDEEAREMAEAMARDRKSIIAVFCFRYCCCSFDGVDMMLCGKILILFGNSIFGEKFGVLFRRRRRSKTDVNDVTEAGPGREHPRE